MPIYEYVCKACQKIKEVWAGIKSRPRSPKCDHCKKPMEKSISRTSFTLKGSGWGRDGYSKN